MTAKELTFLERVCHAFQRARVDCAVVGGQAVALHGAVRGTIDVDVTLRWTREVVVKAEMALTATGLVSRLPVTAQDMFDRRDDYIENRNLIAWNFYDPNSPIDEVGIITAYDLSGKSVKRLVLPSGELAVLSIEDLIEMKRSSGRPQDLADAQALELVMTDDPRAASMRDRPAPCASVVAGETPDDPLAHWSGPLRPPERPRATQFFSPEYLRRCKQFSLPEIVRFLDEFKRNYAAAEAARQCHESNPGAVLPQ